MLDINNVQEGSALIIFRRMEVRLCDPLKYSASHINTTFRVRQFHSGLSMIIQRKPLAGSLAKQRIEEVIDRLGPASA